MCKIGVGDVDKEITIKVKMKIEKSLQLMCVGVTRTLYTMVRLFLAFSCSESETITNHDIVIRISSTTDRDQLFGKT